MKYIITFLFLLLISTVYCRDFLSNIFEGKCEKQSKEYLECNEEFSNLPKSVVMVNFGILCSKKCKKYLSNPVKATPACFEDREIDQKSLDIIKEINEMNCATDGGGYNCPNTQGLIDNEIYNEKKFDSSKEDAYEIAKKTCKSKYCTDALIKIHNTTINFIDYSRDMITFLNSKECRDQNSSVSLKIGFSLAITIALFFTFLF